MGKTDIIKIKIQLWIIEKDQNAGKNGGAQMENRLCVKGRLIGHGKPLVCVPVMESTKEGILKETGRLVGLGADMIEWRVDAFDEVRSLNAIREVLKELEPLVRDTILVYTFRSKNQGGLMALSQEEIYDIHQAAAEMNTADFVDVEYFEAKKAKQEIAALQAMGVRVIASHHDFDQTPERKVIRMLLDQICESGADVAKLAVMPQNTQDVLDLLEETNFFHQQHPDIPLITMSMGKMGMISRLAGEFFGSCVTFGAGEKASAPGQLPMKDAEEILCTLHSYIEG